MAQPGRESLRSTLAGGQQGGEPSDDQHKIPTAPGPAAVKDDMEGKTPTAGQQGGDPSDSQHKIPATPEPAAVQHGKEVNTRAHHAMDIEVRSTGDSNGPYITGCVVLNGDKLVVVDCKNHKVKLIDLTHRSVVSQLLLSAAWDITQVNSTQVAVTSPETYTISFVNVNSDQLKLHRKIKVKGQCRGIASISDKLVVSYDEPVKVEIISMEGKVLHTVISEDKGGEIFTRPSSVAVSNDKHVIYLSDSDRHTVTSFDLTGQILATYKDDKLQKPSGLTVDRAGRVYVCGRGSHNILQLTADLTEIQDLLQQLYSLPWPKSIYYLEAIDRLYIGMGVIQVYQLK